MLSAFNPYPTISEGIISEVTKCYGYVAPNLRIVLFSDNCLINCVDLSCGEFGSAGVCLLPEFWRITRKAWTVFLYRYWFYYFRCVFRCFALHCFFLHYNYLCMRIRGDFIGKSFVYRNAFVTCPLCVIFIHLKFPWIVVCQQNGTLPGNMGKTMLTEFFFFFFVCVREETIF